MSDPMSVPELQRAMREVVEAHLLTSAAENRAAIERVFAECGMPLSDPRDG